jgi:hypothetical protein
MSGTHAACSLPADEVKSWVKEVKFLKRVPPTAQYRRTSKFLEAVRKLKRLLIIKAIVFKKETYKTCEILRALKRK